MQRIHNLNLTFSNLKSLINNYLTRRGLTFSSPWEKWVEKRLFLYWKTWLGWSIFFTYSLSHSLFVFLPVIPTEGYWVLHPWKAGQRTFSTVQYWRFRGVKEGEGVSRPVARHGIGQKRHLSGIWLPGCNGQRVLQITWVHISSHAVIFLSCPPQQNERW